MKWDAHLSRREQDEWKCVRSLRKDVTERFHGPPNPILQNIHISTSRFKIESPSHARIVHAEFVSRTKKATKRNNDSANQNVTEEEAAAQEKVSSSVNRVFRKENVARKTFHITFCNIQKGRTNERTSQVFLSLSPLSKENELWILKQSKRKSPVLTNTQNMMM